MTNGASAAQEEESSDGEASAPADATAAEPGPNGLMNEAEFDAATRAAIQASLRDVKTPRESAGGPDAQPEASPDWQGPAAEAKKKRNRKQRYKENLVRGSLYVALQTLLMRSLCAEVNLGSLGITLILM